MTLLVKDANTAVQSLSTQQDSQGNLAPLHVPAAVSGGIATPVWGTTRVAPNLIEYDDFTASRTGSGGKGKGGGAGKGGGTQYNYSASLIFGICQGPIAAILNVWWDKNVKGLSGFDPNATLYPGNDGQAADPYWQTSHPNEALGYSGTANVVANHHPLGTVATLPNVSFEVCSNFTDAPNGIDANPATIVADYLTNPRYGAGFPAANLDPGAVSQTAASSYWTYCMAAGIFLSPQLDQQQEAQQHLADITRLTNSAVVWSGGVLKIIPYGDLPLAAKYSNAAISGTVAAGDTVGLVFSNAALPGSPVTISYTAVAGDTVNQIAKWLAVFVNANPGLAAFGIRAAAAVSTVMILEQPPQGTLIAASVSGGEAVALTVFGTYAFSPAATVQYNLGEDDFIVEESSVGTASGAVPGGTALRRGAGVASGGFGDDPVHIARSSPADADNLVHIEFRDRGNDYNSTVVESFDQAAIDAYGIRRDTSLKAAALCNAASALVVAQLLLQRRLYFRNTYTFRLGWKYCLLEPMDLVAISDPRLGAAALTVRITAIEEDAEGTLSVTAEDFVPGWATAGFYPQPAAGGYVPNWSAAPGNANPPVIFEPPAALLSGDLEIWVALSGGANWGGAQVWVSSDGSTYAYAGAVDGPAIMGTSSADLPGYAGAEPDTTHTLSVDLGESRGQLTSVSAADAQNLVTLCWLGGELLAFQTATLTAAYKYDLATLWRGAYASPIADHPAGTQFARLDGSVGRFPYPATLVGQEIYLKFLSFNLTGGGLQSLSDVAAYTYTVTGGGKPTGNFPVSGFASGSPAAGAVLQRYVFAAAVTFPAGLGGSRGSAQGAPAGSAVTIHIEKNGSLVGTMRFAVGATTASFTMAAATTFNAGDQLALVMEAVTDASFVNPAWTLLGNA